MKFPAPRREANMRKIKRTMNLETNRRMMNYLYASAVSYHWKCISTGRDDDRVAHGCGFGCGYFFKKFCQRNPSFNFVVE